MMHTTIVECNKVTEEAQKKQAIAVVKNKAKEGEQKK
jgi:hypothetical protein